MDPDDLKRRIASFPFWYHRIELPGEVTPGTNPIHIESFRIPNDLTGKLDRQ